MKKGEIAGWIIFSFAVLSLVLLSNFSVIPIFIYNEKRIVESLLLVLNSILFIGLYFNIKFVGFSSKTSWTFGILLLFLCVSSLLAPLSAWAFLEVGWYLLLSQLVFLTVWLYQRNKERFICGVTIALFLLAGIYVLHVLANTFSSFLQEGWPTWPHTAKLSIMVDGEQVIPQGFLGFSNKRFLNHLQTWSLPLMVFGVIYYKEELISGLRYIMIGIISCWWMLVFAAEARGTMVASLVSMAIIFYLYRGKTRAFLKTYVMVVGIGLMGYTALFLIPNGAGGIVSRYGDHSGRLDLWYICLKNIISHPFMGLGPMHYAHTSINAKAAHPHNFILQTIVEWGIPATMLLAIIFSNGYVKFIKIKDLGKKDFLVQVALIASLTAGIAHSMVSGIFNTALSQLLFCIILGWAIGHYFEHSENTLFQRRRKITWSVWVVGLLLLVNTGYVVQKVGSDILMLKQRNEQYIETSRNENSGHIQLHPRFWQQGKIGIVK